MTIIETANSTSRWRGLEYYQSKKVSNLIKLNGNEYESTVKGSGNNVYSVKINLEHPKKSVCTCPFANGRKVCKHMVATYYAAFPDEADMIIKEEEEYEEEQERRRQEEYESVVKYVNSLTKAELREKLISYMLSDYDEDYEEYWYGE